VVSPVPKHLRTAAEHEAVPAALREHVADLVLDPSKVVKIPGAQHHRAKFPPGLATELVRVAGTHSVGDPMAGTGTLAWETGLPVALNDIDRGMSQFLQPLVSKGCTITYKPATQISWEREVCIFSPPYYPRTDRRVPNAHDDAKRGPVVGFRDCYNSDHPSAIGNPGGVDAILRYREQMTAVYRHLATRCERMIVVTKNWMRLGVELRLDLDTLLMAESVGWRCVARHGFAPKPSLWARFNAERGEKQGRTGMVGVEDVLVFRRAAGLV
jgi:hypothetical protein